jgi:hypothetical protein
MDAIPHDHVLRWAEIAAAARETLAESDGVPQSLVDDVLAAGDGGVEVLPHEGEPG